MSNYSYPCWLPPPLQHHNHQIHNKRWWRPQSRARYVNLSTLLHTWFVFLQINLPFVLISSTTTVKQMIIAKRAIYSRGNGLKIQEALIYTQTTAAQQFHSWETVSFMEERIQIFFTGDGNPTNANSLVSARKASLPPFEERQWLSSAIRWPGIIWNRFSVSSQRLVIVSSFIHRYKCWKGIQLLFSKD